MARLDIRAHSPRISGYAVAGLMLLGAGAFAAGVVHQLNPAGPLPFPPPQPPSLSVAAASPAPEPVLQAPTPDRPARHAEVEEASADIAPPAAAQAAADASATAPDAVKPPSAPELQPPEAPTTAPPPPAAPGDADPPT